MNAKRKWDLGAVAALFIVLAVLVLGAVGYAISRYQAWQRDVRRNVLQGQLAFAAASGDTREVQTLLQAGAPVNQLSADGRSALVGAVQLRKNAVVKLLLDAGADPNASGSGTPPPLFEAVTGANHPGQRPLVRMLLDSGANPNEQNPSRNILIAGPRNFNVMQQTALMRAVIEQHDELVSLLLEHKSNANLADSDGKTALHWWVLFRQNDRLALPLGPLLVREGADPYLRDKSGKSPLDYAREFTDPVLRHTLEKAAAIHSRSAAWGPP